MLISNEHAIDGRSTYVGQDPPSTDNMVWKIRGKTFAHAARRRKQKEESRKQAAGSRQQKVNSRQQAADSRQQKVNSRQQIAEKRAIRKKETEK
jgi:hypothetical protein